MWTKTKPDIPKTTSKFYWYYDESIEELFPVEIWPGRYIKHYEGWWWNTPIDKPKKPKIKVKKKRRKS